MSPSPIRDEMLVAKMESSRQLQVIISFPFHLSPLYDSMRFERRTSHVLGKGWTTVLHPSPQRLVTSRTPAMALAALTDTFLVQKIPSVLFCLFAPLQNWM